MNIRDEMIAELLNQQNDYGSYNEDTINFGVMKISKYYRTLNNFCKWYIENRETSALREDLRSDMEKIISSQEIVDSVIDSMNEEEIKDSGLKAYRREVARMSPEEQVDEMLSWGYEMPDLKKNEEHIYLLVKLTVDESVDHEEAVNECDYVFTHDNILGSEILDYRSEQDNQSPVLYFP